MCSVAFVFDQLNEAIYTLPDSVNPEKKVNIVVFLIFHDI